MKLRCLSLLAILLALISIPAFADSVPVGYISYDVVGVNLAEFDIGNLTGPNSLYPDFPISNSVDFTNLSLVVDYLGGTTATFGSSYFTLAPDGLSYNGDPLSTIEAGPIGLSNAIGAVLTGTFDTPTLVSAGGPVYIVSKPFSVSLNDSAGLTDGDLAVIDATGSLATPEPSALILAGTGLIGLFLTRRKLIGLRKGLPVGVACLFCAVLFDAKDAHAQSVTLGAYTLPNSGAAGTTAVSITGSGYPSGTIPSSNVTVVLAPTCDGAGIGTPATVVNKVLGSTEKIQFVLPSSLSTGTYYVSVSGSNATGTAFASTNCGQVSVVGASPTANLSASSITFPSQIAGTSASQGVNLTNTGTTALGISGFAFSGTAANLFNETNNCPSSLSPGSYCTVTINFAPTTAASYSASLTISDNASPATQSVSLSGTATPSFINGKVYGGQQPVSGAAVTLWSAGTASYGGGATSIATATTDVSGSYAFGYSGVSPCTTGQNLFVTSVGGTGTSPYTALMTALPPGCGPNTVGTYAVINEVTTIASVTALQQFMSIAPGGTPAWNIGSPAANASGLTNAFLQVGNLISLGLGTSAVTTATSTFGSVLYTTTVTPDSNKINVLADILASCVGTSGSSTCSPLFTDTTPGTSAAPTDTIQAAYYLATNASGLNLPAHGTSQGEPFYLCNAYVGSTPPFPTNGSCTAAIYPTDWAIGVSWSTSNGSAVIGTATPYSLAIDGSGDIWTAYSCSSSTGCTDTGNDTHNGPAYVTKFNPQGQVQFAPVTSTPMTAGPGLTAAVTGSSYSLLAGAPFSLAIDTNNNAWFDSYYGANPLSPGSSIGGVIAKVAPGGVSTGYVITASVPGAIAIDGSNNIWLDDAPSYNAGNRDYLSELEYKSGAYSTFDVGLGRQTSIFSGVWVDSLGYGWSADSSASKCGAPNGTIYRATTVEMETPVNYISPDDVTGVTTCPLWSGTPDATGGAFYANGGLYHVTVAGSSGARTAVMASEAAGTGTTNGGLDNGAGTVVDGFGNVWVANSTGGGVSEFTYTGSGFTPLSPSGTAAVPVYGFGSSYLKGSTPINIATDSSGNVWIGTQSTKLWYLVGIAGPTVTPISQMLKTSFIGSRPGALTLASLSPALTYSSVASIGQPMTATLTNTGSSGVNISGITIGGTNSSDFSVSGTTCGSTLAIGANCAITVTFNSITAGTFAGTLNVASNAAGSPSSVNLTGTAFASAGSINLSAGTIPPSGPAISFGSVVAPTTTTGKAVVLTNTGSTPMSLTLGLTGPGANLFPETTSCGSSLAAGASCFVSFKFSPKVAGGYLAALTVTNNAGTGQGASLSGTATPFTISVNTTNASSWIIDTGAVTMTWNGAIPSMILDGYPDQLTDASQGLYMDNTGAFGNLSIPTGGAASPSTTSCTSVGVALTGSQTCATGTGSTPYFDWAVTTSDTANSGNAYTFVQHWLVFPNDPGVHVYTQLVHNTNDIAGGVGQMQWVFRNNGSIFTNSYEVNSGLGLLGAEDIPLPPANDPYQSDPGRTVQNAATDLHGDPNVSASFGRWFETKYDYAGYEYLHQAQGLYGPAPSGTTYGMWTVIPKLETLVGGPTKQDLFFTGNLDMIEVYSNHENNNLTLNTAAGATYNRLFGPYYVHINTLGTAYSQTGTTLGSQADLYADAVSSGAALVNNYDTVAPLVAAGYVRSTGRGSVSIQVNGVAGAAHTAWAVLSDPNTNHQFSSQGMQYWADISQNGSGTITGVAPGTYRLSVYALGQWGEYRQDGIVVTANSTITVPTVTFQPENFTNVNGVANGETVFTIGTADRSSHEFLHGHNTVTGNDDREYYGNWNYWQDFVSNQGAVVYYATAVGSTPATNDLSKWNYYHPSTFNPGLFGGVFNSADDTTDGYSQYPGQTYPGINGLGPETAIPTYVSSLPSASGTNGASTGVPSWQVYFATPTDIANYHSGNVELSISSACAYGSYVVTLNPQSANVQRIWHYTNYSDCMIRSGLSGYTQWFAMEFPASALNQTPGGSNEITISMSGTGAEDDAIRLELTNSTSNPAVTGWNDYTYVTGTNFVGTGTANSSGLANNDAVPNP